MIICQCESKKKNTGLKVWQHWYGKMSWPSNNQISLSNHQSVIPPVKWDQLGTYWASFWAPFLLLSFLPLLQLHVLSFYQCDQGVTSPLELLHNTHQIRSFELPHMKIYTHTKKTPTKHTQAEIYHGSPGFEEPVEAELRRVANTLTQLVVHALLVEAQLVKHTDEEAVLLLCVVLAFVGAIGDPELMEGSLVATNLRK